MKEYLGLLISGNSLSQKEAYEAVLKIGSGEVNPSQIAGFLVAIQQKGITTAELIGFREAMLSLALPLDFEEFDAIDVCGTGGDGKDTFNISTTSAFVVAGAGQKVAKHGNHGVSSAVGSSTVLEYLGVKFTNDADYLKKKISEAGICYLHAPLFHPAMRFVGPIRKELGIRTFFNILGPLLNPAKVKKQLTGVSDLKTFEIFEALFNQSETKFGVVHSLDIYDEVSLTSDFKFATKNSNKIVSPADLGFQQCQQIELHGGGSLEESAEIVKLVLANKGTLAQTSAVLANAGLALSIANDISELDGILMAKESLESGRALNSLKKLVE